MPRADLKKIMCRDLAILKIGKFEYVEDDPALNMKNAGIRYDFNVALFEKVTGFPVNKFRMRYPISTLECMEEELEYEFDVWYARREGEMEILIPIEKQPLVDWIEEYCKTHGLTFRKMRWANLFMFKYRHEPWVRKWAAEFREEQKKEHPEWIGIMYE